MSATRSNYAEHLRARNDVAFVDDKAFEHRGQWQAFFRERMGPVFKDKIVFEVGCFDGGYLCRIAAKFPEVAFIGLDWKYKALFEGTTRIAELNLRNVILLRSRAQDVLRIFGKAEVEDIWVFHPDPCDRPAELKNRLIAEAFLVDAHSVLRDAKSSIAIKTDHPGYYQWILGLLNLPEPTCFGDISLRSRLRTRDLMNAKDIPGASDAILRLLQVSSHSADFWNDPTAQAATCDRYFAGEQTLFEARFIRKRFPIYFVQLDKRL